MQNKTSHANFKAVIWDMDGLLIDSERVSFVAWNQGAASIGESIDESIFRELIGRTSEGILKKLAELLGDQIDTQTLQANANLAYSKLIEGGVPLKRGAKACIERLTQLEVPQAVASSSELYRIEQKLGHHDLLRHFDAIVAGDHVQSGKPDPEPYSLAARRLEVLPSECIAFEDSVNGVLSAHRAGMKTILVPDLAIHDDESLSRTWKRLDSLEAALPLLTKLFIH